MRMAGGALGGGGDPYQKWVCFRCPKALSQERLGAHFRVETTPGRQAHGPAGDDGHSGWCDVSTRDASAEKTNPRNRLRMT